MNEFATQIPLEHRIALEKQAGEVIERLVAENASLSEKLAAAESKLANYERRERAHGLARTMEERGFLSNRSFDEKVAHILKHDDLDKVAHAMDLATDDGTKIASVADVTDRGTSARERAVHFFLHPDEPADG